MEIALELAERLAAERRGDAAGELAGREAVRLGGGLHKIAGVQVATKLPFGDAGSLLWRSSRFELARGVRKIEQLLTPQTAAPR